jgi:glyoxylase-like metal-dependent hydrolase (beta-lactamase superfamily II)
MIFRQLFEPESSTYTYLFGCPDTRKAILLDPVLESAERDLSVLQDLGLQLACTLETHIHADHITAGCRLHSLTGSRIAHPALDGLSCADIAVAEGRPLKLGSLRLQPLFTPGHTDTHHSYVVEVPGVLRVFTGDAGDAPTLFWSVREKIFSLPDDTLVYPSHDYQHRHVSTVAQERERNPRLGGGRTLDAFVAIMRDLKLPYPKKMEIAVPANRNCGDCGDDVAQALRHAGGKAEQGASS